MTGITNAPKVFETNKQFYLKNRALHVISEAARVFDFQSVCGSDAAMDQKLKVHQQTMFTKFY
jgi:hypothetical protein